MLKKLTAYAICICVMLGTVIYPAEAAAPIVFSGNKVTHFDRSFGGGTDASSFADFDITNGGGTWLYAPDYIMEPSGTGKVMTKNTYDMTGADSFEFKIKTITTNNGYKVYMGDYTLTINRNVTVLFYGPIKYTPSWGIDYGNENCLAYTNNANGATPVTGTSYGGVVNATIRVEGNTLSVSTDVSDRTGTLTYTAPEKIAINGKFGVEGGTDECFTLFSVSLTSGNVATVNDWKYEKVFSAADTVESLARDGLVFNEAQFTGYNTTDKYLATAKSTTYTFAPDGNAISGDYTLAVEATYGWGGHQYRFNYIDDSNYYELSAFQYNADGLVSTNITLKKVKGGTATTLHNENIRDTTADNYMSLGYKKAVYKVSVDEEDGKKIITASVSGGGKESTIPVITDADPIVQGGIIKSVQSNGDLGKQYSFKIYSTPSGEDTVSDVTLTDKTISSTDTLESVANDYGIIAPNGPVKQNNYYALNGGGSGKEILYDRNLSGSYTITTKTYVHYNAFDYYINYRDKDNYYKIVAAKTGITEAYKMKDGQQTALTVTPGESNASDYSHNYKWETINTKVEPADNSLKLTIDMDNGEGQSMSYTITDSTAPVTEGRFKIIWASNGTCLFNSLKVVRHRRPSGVVEGVFNVNNSETYAYTKGAIKFTMPTVMLGSYKVVAALYEDNAMTDIKVLNEFDLFTGEISLFDTTNSAAQSGSVKVYLVDTTDTLNKITDVWELK